MWLFFDLLKSCYTFLGSWHPLSGDLTSHWPMGSLKEWRGEGGSAFGGFTCDFSFLPYDHHRRSPISSAKERGAIPRTRVVHAPWCTKLSRIFNFTFLSIPPSVYVDMWPSIEPCHHLLAELLGFSSVTNFCGPWKYQVCWSRWFQSSLRIMNPNWQCRHIHGLAQQQQLLFLSPINSFTC